MLQNTVFICVPIHIKILLINNEYKLFNVLETCSMNVGPCHHGMTAPQVADGGTTSDMEGSCEYIE
jgi:hypothetical protein